MGKFWPAIEWDLGTQGVNALDYFSVGPTRFGRGRDGFRSGRTLGQLIRKWETFSGVRGSYCFAMQHQDPESIAAIAELIKDDGKPSAPPLFGWTEVVDRLVNIGDQLIANRGGDPKKVKFYPRPLLPAMTYRKRRAYEAIDLDIEAAQKRYSNRRKLL